MKDPSIIKIDDKSIEFHWSTENHKYFSNEFKEEVNILYKCLKKLSNLLTVQIE